MALSLRKYKTWSEVLFWFLNAKYLKYITTFAWAWNYLSHCHTIWSMHRHIVECWWLKSYRDHSCYELACWFLSVNCLFSRHKHPFMFLCNWWIQLLMHLVFLLYNSPYVIVTSTNSQVIYTLFACFVFICLFQVDKSSCCLTNSCSCWAFIFQLWFH